MAKPPQPSQPKKRYRDRGGDGISWDKTNKCYVGTISLGFTPRASAFAVLLVAGRRPKSGTRLDELHQEIKIGIFTPATYTVGQCVKDWLDSMSEIRTPWPRSTVRPRSGSIHDRRDQAQGLQGHGR